MKRRMNAERRNTLLAYIEDNVRNVTLSKLVLDAVSVNTQLRDAVVAEVEKQFPPKDMAFLAKYGCTQNPISQYWEYIYVHCGNDDDGNGARTINVKMDPKENLVVPTSKDGLVVPQGHKIFKLFDHLEELQTQQKDRTEEIMRDYRTLISNSRYFEDILEVAPDLESQAEILFPVSTAVSVLSEEAIARIKRDSLIRVD